MKSLKFFLVPYIFLLIADLVVIIHFPRLNLTDMIGSGPVVMVKSFFLLVVILCSLTLLFSLGKKKTSTLLLIPILASFLFIGTIFSEISGGLYLYRVGKVEENMRNINYSMVTRDYLNNGKRIGIWVDVLSSNHNNDYSIEYSPSIYIAATSSSGVLEEHRFSQNVGSGAAFTVATSSCESSVKCSYLLVPYVIHLNDEKWSESNICIHSKKTEDYFNGNYMHFGYNPDPWFIKDNLTTGKVASFIAFPGGVKDQYSIPNYYFDIDKWSQAFSVENVIKIGIGRYIVLKSNKLPKPKHDLASLVEPTIIETMHGNIVNTNIQFPEDILRNVMKLPECK